MSPSRWFVITTLALEYIGLLPLGLMLGIVGATASFICRRTHGT